MKENLILNLVEDVDKILYTFEKDGKFAMSSSIRNELFQEANKSLKQVKEALAQPEQLTEKEKISREMTAEIVAARTLAQPEQEPVYLAWFYEEEGWFETTKDHYDITDEEDRWLLYPAPPKREWIGLTDEEIDEIDEVTWDSEYQLWGIHDFSRAIEAKLKEKNT